MPASGGVKEEGEGGVVVDQGNGDGSGDGEGVEVVDPPNVPLPLPHWLLKALGPQSAPPGRWGQSSDRPVCWSRGARGINPLFPPPRIAT